MQNRFNRLWVFGDSYTTPDYCVPMKDSFWGLTAETLKIPMIVNCSRPVNSWTTIQHLIISLSNSIDWKQDLIFVGIPPLERITVFDNHKNTEYFAHEIETTTWTKQLFPINYHRGLRCLQNYGTDKQLILHSDRSWLETDVMRQIFLISKWLEGLSANYLILNLSKDFDKNNRWGPSDFVLDYCLNLLPSILFEKTYHGINIGVNRPADSDNPEGHHGPAGNSYFFKESLLFKLKECNLC